MESSPVTARRKGDRLRQCGRTIEFGLIGGVARKWN